jgi:hypothetical protein
MDIKLTIAKACYAVYQALMPPRPQPNLLELPSITVSSELAGLGISPIYGRLDSRYYFTDAQSWADILYWIYFEFPMPIYVAERWDCDDFSFFMRSLVGAYFHLNGIGSVIGNALGGCHAWNMFRVEDRWVELEPQTGEIFEFGQNGYTPLLILI